MKDFHAEELPPPLPGLELANPGGGGGYIHGFLATAQHHLKRRNSTQAQRTGKPVCCFPPHSINLVSPTSDGRIRRAGTKRFGTLATPYPIPGASQLFSPVDALGITFLPDTISPQNSILTARQTSRSWKHSEALAGSVDGIPLHGHS